MEYIIAPIIIWGLYLAIKGFGKAKRDERLYKYRVQQMTNGELRHEISNLNRQVAHLPKHVWRNSPQGALLQDNRNKAKVVEAEMNRRGMN